MNEQELRFREHEAEMLAMMGIVSEVCRLLAEISTQHETAVRDGFDEAVRALSYALDNTPHAAVRENFGYALKTVEWLTLSALAPTQGGKAHGTVQ